MLVPFNDHKDQKSSFDSVSHALSESRPPRFEKVRDYSTLSIYELFSERERMSFFNEVSDQRLIERLIKDKFIPKTLYAYIKRKFEEADDLLAIHQIQYSRLRTVMLNDFFNNDFENNLVHDRKFWFDLLPFIV